MHNITLIEGDGVGPEITSAACRVLEALNIAINWDVCLAGKKVFESGVPTGVPLETIKSIEKNKIVLKGPLETPIGYGAKSANVTLRKLFETFANVRPAKTIPGVKTPYSDQHIDMVIIRENVEDLYTGIEHMQTPDVAQCLKIITRLGCEKIVRFAFEFAQAEGRKSVHCATKANIMKLSEGFLKRIFEEVAVDYPDIDAHHIIVDNCAHQLVMNPGQFDVIVTTNLNGDILSDLASGLVGGLGFAPSANMGNAASMFEAVHGSAPTIAGQDIVNPTSIILSAAMMLRHMGLFEEAHKIDVAVTETLKAGIFTKDVAKEGQIAVGTKEFTDHIIKNLDRPSSISATERAHKSLDLTKCCQKKETRATLEDKGFDIMLRAPGNIDVAALARTLKNIAEGTGISLQSISNRGMQMYPIPHTKPDCVDSWNCRFTQDNGALDDRAMHAITTDISQHHSWSHIEKLAIIDGAVAYAKSQGED